MIDYKIILIPLIGAFIGFLTNYVAVKMLFHPRRKFFGIQGVFPKRKNQLAKKIAEISPEILPESFEKLKDNFLGRAILNIFQKGVENKIQKLDDEKIEEIVWHTANYELNFIMWIGALLGLLIGIIQILIFRI